MGISKYWGQYVTPLDVVGTENERKREKKEKAHYLVFSDDSCYIKNL